MPTDKPRVTITMSEDQFEKIENYWHDNKMKNQTQAILSLLDAGLSGIEKKKQPQLCSSEALKLARDYDELDQHGKKAVRGIADIELARREDTSTVEQKVIELFPIRKYLQSASAGYGNFNDDASYEMIDLIKRPPVGASFIIAVNGDSMEPTYKDGDLLFVRAQETIQIGEIGLFVQAGHLYIKEAGRDGLISHNNNGKYPVIHAEEDSPIITEGRVLGICTPDYLL